MQVSICHIGVMGDILGFLVMADIHDEASFCQLNCELMGISHAKSKADIMFPQLNLSYNNTLFSSK